MPKSFIPLKNRFAVDSAADGSDASNPEVPRFLTFTPNKMRHAAVKDLCSSFESARTNLKKGNIKHFKIGKQRKKDQMRTFSLTIPTVEGLSIYSLEKQGDVYVKSETGKRTHISIYPTNLAECFAGTKSKKPKRRMTAQEKLDKAVRSLTDTYGCLYADESDFEYWEKVLARMDEDDRIKEEKRKADEKARVKPAPLTPKEVSHLLLSQSIRIKHKNKDKLIPTLSFDYDCKLVKKYDAWYLHVPYVRQTKRKEPTTTDATVALDPGFKTFQTYYSESSHGKIQQSTRLSRIRKELDYAHYKRYGIKVKGVEGILMPEHRWRAKKFRIRTNILYRKQEQLSDDLHSKAIQFLTTNFNWILLPPFETQDMVTGFRLGKKTKREASQLRHYYQFKQKLYEVTSQMTNCKVINAPEPWTSKTCTSCGTIKHDLQVTDRTYACEKCGKEFDRDVAAARNILLRNVV